MSFLIFQNEALADRRRVPLWLVQSNGTSVATNEAGGQPQMSVNGAAFISTGGTLSAVSANAGRYYVELSQSNVSVLGTITIRYSSTTCFEQGSETVQVVQTNPFDAYLVSVQSRSQSGNTNQIRLGSGETTTDDFYNGVGILVTFNDGSRQFNIISDYTGSDRSATVQNQWITTPSTVTYTLFPGTPAPGIADSVWSAQRSAFSTTGTFGQFVWSQVTGTSSGTVQGVERLNSGVTLNAATHSGATIQGVTRLNSAVTLNADTHSGATVQGVTTVVALSAAAAQSTASSLLSANLGNNRLVQEALFALRNRVQVGTSVATIYRTDDSTSAWTASVSTGSFPLAGFDPTT